MENSSDSNWQRWSGSSTVSSRNPRRIPVRLSGDGSRIVAGRREKTQANRLGTQFKEDVIRPVESKDVSLRQWLDNTHRVVDALDCLHIFMQIVEIVNLAHSQGFVVQNVCPSCFVMSSFNRVSFIESVTSSDSGSDESNNQTDEFVGLCSPNPLGVQSGFQNNQQVLQMESGWYTSPEEAAGAASSCASDVYRLGVLLFELYCTSSSVEEKNATMCSLRHRVFPPHFLLKWSKEALFCLWLLHPEPASRPKIDEVLKSEFLNEPRDDLIEREAFIELKEKIEEQELLLEFLLTLQQRKQEAADSLRRTVAFVSSDLQEVAKLHTSISKQQGLDSSNDGSPSSGSRKRIKTVDTSNSIEPEHQENAIVKSSRLMKNFKKLESAYFSTRRRALKPLVKPLTLNARTSSDGKGSTVDRSSANSFPPINRLSQNKQSGWINSFIDGLSKYLSFRNLKVKADLKQGDLLNSSSLVCSLGFDRDGEFFATAGVNKKIKVFEYESILNDNRDIHYPVVEMSSRSKLSSICWNNYIKGQIASSNFEGVVQIWDVTRNQVYMELKEHERRVWSVDFSWSNPTLVASGSDDGSVKLWNINQAILFLHLVDGTSVGTIKTKANVCCVQFPSDTGNTLAFGSADHRVYYYDLRNPGVPLYTLIGHNKTVSYVKFLDSSTLVSSSTDNTLKLWDLSESTSQVIDCPVQSFTGHMNVKNFVGLSVSDGYIATGSETNEVVVYHKAFPMPALSYKFNTTDPISGDEVDDSDQFISSVCWRVQSSTLVAANSMGNIKLLDMV
ncbi:putative transcription factor WD40-like family [Helianthus annuus]|uniref:Transcription factor WD40-like family n=1 Tax=Helianthus annuus TaxID=4232 RepID=A0A251SC97_HELAN|nr:putative transcription factor WD40-like family [Helianthus annuus]KAJ0833265.1 putative transcription factor WD40-like family [Helianthus annuus]KAJ0846853.1 putative transcription factor WD40-like family [Helianthus annuus]